MNSETIKDRKSVRTYERKHISEQTMEQIREFLKQNDNPFGVPVKFYILDADKDGVSSPVIMGADIYVAGKYQKQKNAEIAFGYSFEKFILYATTLGLGRLPFEELFFERDFQHPMREENAGVWSGPLAMVRIAPSATNKQPWRVVIEGNRAHFYEVKTKGYDKESTGDIQKVDLGIALCHFEIAAKEAGLSGKFVQVNPGIITAEDTEYIATYEEEKE